VSTVVHLELSLKHVVKQARIKQYMGKIKQTEKVLGMCGAVASSHLLLVLIPATPPQRHALSRSCRRLTPRQWLGL